MTIADFLKQTVKQINSVNVGQHTKKLKALFIVGNESADMDSCTSSIITAYMCRRAVENRIAYQNGFRPDIIAPIMNMGKSDLRLRGDIQHLFDQLGLADSLIYLDDLANSDLGLAHKVEPYVFLVDCNRVPSELDTILKGYEVEPQVVGIIDHHADERLYTDTIARYEGPRILQKSGSCSSLVVNYWKQQLGEQVFTSADDQAITKLGLAPLLIDTSNMERKVEESDKEAMATLKKSLEKWSAAGGAEMNPNGASGGLGRSFDNKSFYKDLQRRKKDISRLSARDIMRKDYKQWDQIGISSTVEPLTWIYQHHPDFNHAMKDWAQERGLKAYAALASAVSPKDGEFHREIVVWARDQQIQNKVQEFYELARERLKLELKSIDEADAKSNELVTFFEQNNREATRKQVAPLMRQALDGIQLQSL